MKDAVLRKLRGITTLTELSLVCCTKVTDVGLRELRGLTQITKLYLDHCFWVTDVGLRELRSLTQLNKLDLIRCFNSDGRLAATPHVPLLSALTRLYLSNNPTTEVGRDALETAVPALTIDWWY